MLARLLQHLHALEPEFWLPLPLIGILLWIAGGIGIELLVKQSSSPVVPLHRELQFNVQPVVNFLEIRAEIYKSQNHTSVKAIKIFGLSAEPESVEFDLPTTIPTEVELAISQHLGIPIKTVRRLVSYQIHE